MLLFFLAIVVSGGIGSIGSLVFLVTPGNAVDAVCVPK